MIAPFAHPHAAAFIARAHAAASLAEDLWDGCDADIPTDHTAALAALLYRTAGRLDRLAWLPSHTQTQEV